MLGDIGVGLVNSIFAAVTIIVLSIFILSSGRRFLDAWIREYQPDREEWWHRLFERIGNAIGNYVAGALLQATIAGVTSYIMLLILGVDFALPLAVIVFLLDLIPLVGATLGAIIVGIVTLFSDFPVDTIIWAVFAIVYQQVENNVIQPRIQARAVQLDPLIVLVSVLFGSALAGVLGALLAIPVAAALQITYIEYRAQRRQAPSVIRPGPDRAPQRRDAEQAGADVRADHGADLGHELRRAAVDLAPALGQPAATSGAWMCWTKNTSAPSSRSAVEVLDHPLERAAGRAHPLDRLDLAVDREDRLDLQRRADPRLRAADPPAAAQVLRACRPRR